MRIEGDRNRSAITQDGIGVEAGERVEITNFVQKGKHFEIHLNGGGRNFLLAGLESPGEDGTNKRPGGSRINLRFERDIKDYGTNLAAEKVQELLTAALIFSETEMAAAEQEILRQSVEIRQEIDETVAENARETRLQTRYASAEDMSQIKRSDYVTEHLKSNPAAHNVAMFLLGHMYGYFPFVANTTQSFVDRRGQLYRELPRTIAEQREQQWVTEQERVLRESTGPFFLGGPAAPVPLQYYLPPTAEISIIDVKSGTSGFGQRVTNVWVQVDYPDRSSAAATRYYSDITRNDYRPTGQLLRRTLLVIPTRNAIVVAGSGAFSAFAGGLVPEIRRVSDLDEYW